MSAGPAILRPRYVSPIKPFSATYKRIGGVANPYKIANWFQSTRKFSLDFSLSGYSASLAYDYLDPDVAPGGLIRPGVNPSGLQATLKTQRKRDTPYWRRWACQRGAGSIVSQDDGTGDIGFDFFLSSCALAGAYKNTDDDLYYSSCFFSMHGGTGDDYWIIAGFDPGGGDAVASFSWLGNSVPLYGGGSGAGGTITLQSTEYWGR